MDDNATSDTSSIVDMKNKFNGKLKFFTLSQNANLIMSTQKYDEIIEQVQEAKAKKKSSLDYRRIKRYSVLSIGEVKKLIVPIKEGSGENIKYYVTMDEVYDIIHSAHIECGHGGRTRVEKAVSAKYANITRDAISTYLQLCVTCQKKRKLPKKGVTVKPLLFKEINARGQVDLIDMQTCKDGEYKYILNYQDHLTKFLILRAHKTKTAGEVAHTLLDIFCILGTPSVLQSDNGREFANKVVEALKEVWPELKIVHGKPSHSQSQGSVERANQDVQNKLTAWMEDNNTTHWSEGRKTHTGIQSHPESVKATLETEENLEEALKYALEEKSDNDDSLPAELIGKTERNAEERK